MKKDVRRGVAVATVLVGVIGVAVGVGILIQIERTIPEKVTTYLIDGDNGVKYQVSIEGGLNAGDMEYYRRNLGAHGFKTESNTMRHNPHH